MEDDSEPLPPKFIFDEIQWKNLYSETILCIWRAITGQHPEVLIINRVEAPGP